MKWRFARNILDLKIKSKISENPHPQTRARFFFEYLIRELNGSAHGTLNMTQYFAWPCGWVANNCLALQQGFHLYLNNNNNNNSSSIVLTMVPTLNGTKLNQFRLGICITAPELSV